MNIDEQSEKIIYDYSQHEKEELATVFSEGNDYLKKVLINLWNSEVKTYGCCAGHNDKEGKVTSKFRSYVYFELNDNSYVMVSEIIDIIVSNGIEDVCISLGSRNNELENKKELLCSISAGNEQIRDAVFNKIAALMIAPKVITKRDEMIDYLRDLNTLVSDTDLTFDVDIIANKPFHICVRPYITYKVDEEVYDYERNMEYYRRTLTIDSYDLNEIKSIIENRYSLDTDLEKSRKGK